MIRINLLPHREQKRRDRKNQFFVVLAIMALLGLLVGFIGYSYIDGELQHQNRRNHFLETKISGLDKEIEEIKDLQARIEALLARKEVIESLQNDRVQAVIFMDELVKRIPDGIYLSALKQTNSVVKLTGISQSNTRVSHLMRNLEESPFLENPNLVEVKASTHKKRRASEFVLDISVAKPKKEDDAEEMPE